MSICGAADAGRSGHLRQQRSLGRGAGALTDFSGVMECDVLFAKVPLMRYISALGLQTPRAVINCE